MIPVGIRSGVAAFVAQGFGLGLAPIAPGTCASVGAMVLAFALENWAGFAAVAGATIFAIIGGLWAVNALPDRGASDAPGIVIDEIAGQLLAVWPLSASLAITHAAPEQLWPGWVAAFAFFRIFDILKPWPIRLLDRRTGPVWVMLDDLVAGGFAAGAVLLAAMLFHGAFA